jgi:hypothetical protein
LRTRLSGTEGITPNPGGRVHDAPSAGKSWHASCPISRDRVLPLPPALPGPDEEVVRNAPVQSEPVYSRRSIIPMVTRVQTAVMRVRGSASRRLFSERMRSAGGNAMPVRRHCKRRCRSHRVAFINIRTKFARTFGQPAGGMDGPESPEGARRS